MPISPRPNEQPYAPTGQGRAGIINLAIYRALEGDVFKG